MANKRREGLISQICTDLLDWENRAGTRKLLLNLFQKSKIDKVYIEQTYRSTRYKEIKTSLMGRSELKFFIDTFFGTPCRYSKGLKFCYFE